MTNYWQKGFSMVQVMVAISAAAGTGYYLMNQQISTNKLNSKSLSQEVVDTASAVIKTSLASSAICSLNIAGKQTGDVIPTLLSESSQIIAQQNQDLTSLVQGIKLLSMKINSFKDPVSGEVADYLYVVYDLDPNKIKKMVGSTTVSKKFRLRGKKAFGKYVFCYHEESNMVELSAKRNCEEMRGVWNNWDCTMDMNQFVDTSSIRCPLGKLIVSIPGSRVKTACAP